jgi:hypothetical protein
MAETTQEEAPDKKSGFWGWFSIIFPPVSLFALIPFGGNMMTSMPLAAGGIASLVSLWRLIVWSIKWALGRYRKSHFPFPDQNIRRLLTLVIFFSIIQVQSLERAKTNGAALAIAKQMQAQCDAAETCSLPKGIPEAELMTSEQNRLVFRHRPFVWNVFGPVVTILLGQFNMSFSVQVYYGPDWGYTFSGGVGQDIKEVIAR